MIIVGAGLSGFIGRPLKAKLLEKGHTLTQLKRDGASAASQKNYREVLWKPPVLENWVTSLDGADAVVNLTGAPIVDKRWTPKRKKELIESRLLTTKALVEAMEKAKAKPKVFVNASAIGYYGARDPNEKLTEESAAGSGFLADLCREWERQARKAEAFGIRVVSIRTGIVLGRGGGALAKMLPPFRFFFGGPLGEGKQMVSWIHLEDEVGAILFALENRSIRGPVNLAAPNAVSMKEFAQTLGKVLKRPAALPVPAFVLKILLGEMSEMLLTGQNVKPQKLLSGGFPFTFVELEPALRGLL